jgi:TolA-binding protein
MIPALKVLRPFLGVGLSLLMVGCLRTRSDVQQIETTQRIETKVETLKKSNADAEARISEYDDQLRQLRGQIEEVQRFNQVQSQNRSEQEQAFESYKQQMDSKLKLFEQALERIEKQVQSLSQKVSSSRAAAAPQGKRKLGNYGQAQIDFQNRRWKAAAIGYQKYRDLNPKGRRYSEATYRIGVCFQEMKMYSEATNRILKDH